MAEKTEQPTHKRLEDAAKKGQSFKSHDLIVACLTLFGVAYLVSFGSLVELMGVFSKELAGGFNFDQNMHDYSQAVFWLGLKLFMPILALCVVASALPNLLQTGFVLATEALNFDLEKLNPIEGAKKLFSLRSLKDLVKAVLYLVSFGIALWVVWHKHKVLLFSQINGDVFGMAVVWRELLMSLVLVCLACIVVVLVLDAVFEYLLFMKDMKMEREEVKREMKEQEGNPEVKSRRREAHFEILSEQVKSDVENSRVIIANPTHIAVGIYFKPELLPIPLISVLETNQRALAVRAHAEKSGVPVVRDIKLARRIFASHRRYDFVSLEEIDEVLRLLVWLEEVEKAGEEAPAQEEEKAGEEAPAQEEEKAGEEAPAQEEEEEEEKAGEKAPAQEDPDDTGPQQTDTHN